MPDKKKVIIIGCGVAGISAAINLVQNGFHVEIFESKNFPGGRVYSIYDDFAGEEHDNGQHLISGAYKVFLGMLRILDTDKFIKKQKNLKVIFSYPDGEKDILDGSPFAGKIGLLWGLLRLRKLSVNSKLQILFFFVRLLFSKIHYNEISVKGLMIDNKQTPEAIEKFWQPLTLATLNTDIHSAPAVLLIEVLSRAFFSDKESSVLIFPTQGLSKLLNPFNNWISERGGRIHYGESVREFHVENDMITGIKTKSGDIHHADYFITAVQPNSLYKIISNSEVDRPKFDFCKEFDFSTIISVYLWMDKELHGIDFAALIGTNTQWIFNRRDILSETAARNKDIKGHISLTISSGDELNNYDGEALANLCFNEVSTYFPELKGAKLIHKKVIKDKFATVRFTPENQNIRPNTETIFKNLFIAGDWTDTSLPATIEGAAISGKKASKMVLGQK